MKSYSEEFISVDFGVNFSTEMARKNASPFLVVHQSWWQWSSSSPWVCI